MPTEVEACTGKSDDHQTSEYLRRNISQQWSGDDSSVEFRTINSGFLLLSVLSASSPVANLRVVVVNERAVNARRVSAWRARMEAIANWVLFVEQLEVERLILGTSLQSSKFRQRCRRLGVGRHDISSRP
jgi:hypothetical protein